MPDDKWSDDAWDEESDEPPEPDLYTLHSDEVDPVTGQPAGDSTVPGDVAPGSASGPAQDEDVFAASEPLDPAPFPSSGGDDVDELFSNAITNQLAEQGRIAEALDELRAQVGALAAGAPEQAAGPVTARLDSLTDRLGDLETRVGGVLDRLDEILSGSERVAAGVEEVRGDLASQYGAQSAQVLGELDERLSRLESVIGEVAQGLDAVGDRLENAVAARGEPGEGAIVSGGEFPTEAVEELRAAIEAARDAAEAAHRRVDDAAEEQRTDLAGHLESLRVSVLSQLQEQRIEVEALLAEASTRAADPDDAVAQLRGTVAALADDVADAMAGLGAGVTRADLEALEHAVERLAAGGTGGHGGPGDSSLKSMVASQGQAIEMVSDALGELIARDRGAPEALEGIRRSLEESVGALGESAGTIQAAADDAVATVTDVIAKEGAEGRRQLREAGKALAEAIDRVRSLETSMVNYLIERDDRITNERALIAAEFVTLLAEALSKRERRRLARQLSDSEVLKLTEPRKPIPTPAGQSADELVPSRRSRRRGADAEPATRPTLTAAIEESEAAEADDEVLEDSWEYTEEWEYTDEEWADDVAEGEESDEEPDQDWDEDWDEEVEEPEVYEVGAAASSSRPTPEGPTTPKRPASRGGRPGTEQDRQLLARIKGVGPARQDQLLEAFGTAAAVGEASVEEIAALRGISESMAKDIRRRARRLTR
ncbi:MAG: hypothetical protein R3249_03505 [Nitriliruptorales bacterium]|nr:hypothetical protein [Nitriliruptorales bacterium]